MSNSAASAAHSSVSSGRFFSLTSFTSTRKLTAAAPAMPAGGSREGEDVADLGAAQLLVELGDDPAAADLIEDVVGGDHLIAVGPGAVQVDGDVVAVAGRA